VEIRDGRSKCEQHDSRCRKAPRRREPKPPARPRLRLADYLKAKIGLRRRPRRNLCACIAEFSELVSALGAGRQMPFEYSAIGRIDFAVQKRNEQFLVLTHIDVALPDRSPGFSKCAFHARFAELLPQHREPLIQAGFYRTQRTIEEIGDLLEGQAVILLEDDRG